SGGSRANIELPLNAITGTGNINICVSTSDAAGGQIRIASLEDGNGNVPQLSIDTQLPPPAGDQPSTIMSIDGSLITDSSSWAVSNVTEGVRWTNQDRTNQNPHVYAIGPDGKTIATVTMTGPGVTNVDPEAAATTVVNGTPYVYVSDAGGNIDKRDTI